MKRKKNWRELNALAALQDGLPRNIRKISGAGTATLTRMVAEGLCIYVGFRKGEGEYYQITAKGREVLREGLSLRGPDAPSDDESGQRKA